MAKLSIRREAEPKGYFGLDDADYLKLEIDWEDGTRLGFTFAARKRSRPATGWDEDGPWAHFTTLPSEFISAHQKKKKATFGMIWHDYCTVPPIRTADGKISLHLCDSPESTLDLSNSLAGELIAELNRF